MTRTATLALAALLFTLPAAAQTEASAALPLTEAVETLAVDQSLVGDWTLADVEDAGPFARFDAHIDAMAFSFAADGAATATALIAQDGHTYERASTFSFGCADGTIVSADHPAIQYELMDDGSLRLSDATGLAVRMTRADSE